MTEQQQYPEKPSDTSDKGWSQWVNRNYPFGEDWERWLLTRKEQPRDGSPEQLNDLLNDLRGIRDRSTAAFLAAQWWRIFEHGDEIDAARKQDRDQAWQKERARLVRLAKSALEGHLGDAREQRDNAQATAQAYLKKSPEHCSDDDLRDWEKMHRYAKRIANGEQLKRPKLAADVRAERERQRSLVDMDDAIGAADAGRPVMQQERLGGW